VASAAGVTSVRGPNWARNRRSRLAWKRKHQKVLQSDVPLVVAGPAVDGWIERELGGITSAAAVPVSDSESVSGCQGVVADGGSACLSSQGYFSECDASLRRDLRDSRAAFYISENRRRQKENEIKYKALSHSGIAYIREMRDVISLGEGLRKGSAYNPRVAGWAETIVEEVVKSVASSESAPSSVPSLEEIGYGQSSLRSSDGMNEVDLLRERQYQLEFDRISKHYDDMEAEPVDEREFVLHQLKLEYSDVAFTKEENEQMRVKDAVAAILGARGTGHERIEEILEDLDITLYRK